MPHFDRNPQIDVKWYGSAAIELTYKDPAGKPNVVLLYRDREPTLEIGETGRPWSFDGDGKLTDEGTASHLVRYLEAFRDWVRLFAPQAR